MSFRKDQGRVAIIGGGIAGISTAIALKTRLGFKNFVIYEKAGDIGGTWRDNTYPGCGSDIAGHWYSLSTDLNPNWSAYFVSQPEILAYWRGLVQKHGLLSHVKTYTALDKAEWDEEKQLYRMWLRDTNHWAGKEKGGEGHGEVWIEEAEVIVSATGGLSTPAIPEDIEGKDVFAGLSWHSARWRHDVSLAGKKVGVIGNGCSAVQFIPEIAKNESVQVVNFCRTASWLVPHLNYTFPPYLKWAFANIPFLLRSYRAFVAARYEIRYIAFQKAYKGAMAAARKAMTKYIKFKAPQKYHEVLLPKYPPGCKRVVLDNGYLKSLHRPNVRLTFETIECVVPEGIKLKNGEVVELDVIVYATGFELKNIGPNVVGRDGTTLQEYFQSQGGATAYMGTTMPGFPNFYFLMGPNTATGHASLIFSEESQINYALQLISPVVSHKARSFEVRASACDAYNDNIQKRMSKTVFVDCLSWYRSGTGSGGKGKNIAMFPGPISLFWWWTLWPKWEDYVAVGAEQWAKERNGWKRVVEIIAAFSVGLLGIWSYQLI